MAIVIMSEENNLQSEEEKKINSNTENEVTRPVIPAAVDSPAEIPKEETKETQAKVNEVADEKEQSPEVQSSVAAEVTDESVESEKSPVEEVEAITETTETVQVIEETSITTEVKDSEAEEFSEEDQSEKVVEGEEEDNQDEPPHDENEVLPDYTKYARDQLVGVIEELTQQDTFKRSSKILEIIDPLFTAMEDEIRASAFSKYLEEGGEEDSFEFRHDELYNRFDASQRLIRDRRSAFYKEKEAAKERNLAKKEELLEQLRELVDGENDSTNIKPIKEIQETWKAVGPVPNQHNRTLWANYNALLDRFYNNRHILFELKELDRKRNYAAKLELCAKAEALDKVVNIKDAIIQLNELHDEYKRIGAVPREAQEELWQRFKGASDTIYKKRKEYLDGLKGELKVNLVEKEKLTEELRRFLLLLIQIESMIGTLRPRKS